MIRQAQKRRIGFWGRIMPKHRVNLDALIKREDLEVTSVNPEKSGGDVPSISLVELEHGKSMFDVLRKPDFQRETSEWSPEQIVELIKNVLDDELVPAVIVWKAQDRSVFVIDGAHRLSALIAWVNDDYGDQNISLTFYGGAAQIPRAQIVAAKATKKLVDEQIGSFQKLSKFRNNEAGGTPVEIRRAKSAASAHIIVQSVRNDATHAEASFYRINQGGAVIDETEKEIIHARKRPEAVAARALLRAGTGHKYWWDFTQEIQSQIEELAKYIYETLYRPDLPDTIKTLELPMAGRGYSADALAILYEFLHLANGLPRSQVSKSKSKTLEPLAKDDPQRDVDGSKTIEYLNVVKKIANLITSDEIGSLGLHPAVYSYSATGKFQPTAFFAQVQLVQHLRREKSINEFILIRSQFEEFLVSYKYFINQLISNYGANTRALSHLLELYLLVISEISQGKDNESVKNIVLKDARFVSRLIEINPSGNITSPRFSKDTKAAIRIKTALKAAPRCSICHSRYHTNSTTIDHTKNERDGGVGSMDNGTVTHHRRS